MGRGHLCILLEAMFLKVETSMKLCRSVIQFRLKSAMNPDWSDLRRIVIRSEHFHCVAVIEVHWQSLWTLAYSLVDKHVLYLHYSVCWLSQAELLRRLAWEEACRIGDCVRDGATCMEETHYWLALLPCSDDLVLVGCFSLTSSVLHTVQVFVQVEAHLIFWRELETRLSLTK